jgi:DNA-binding transcriptional LysR family regulator
MNIDDVRAFVAVVDTGSVGKAALRLNLTQPAVSRRVQRLEEALGTTLLDRDSKPARPTRVGDAAYRRCVAVLRATEALASETRAEIATVPLRIGLTYALAESVLLPAIEALRARWPETALHLVAGRSDAMRKRLADGQLDAAIVVMDANRSLDDANATRLGAERVVIVASRDAGLPRRVRWSDLAGRPWVINPDGCGFRAQLERALASAGLPMEIIAETYGLALQLALVSRDHGFGLVPARLVDESPYRQRLRIVEIDGFEASLGVWLVRSGTVGLLAPALDVLARSVQEVLTPTSQARRAARELTEVEGAR